MNIVYARGGLRVNFRFRRTAQPAPTAQAPAAQAPAAQAPSTPENQPVGTSGTAAAKGNLPHTASPLPLIGFAGLLALLGAAGVRAVRKATV